MTLESSIWRKPMYFYLFDKGLSFKLCSASLHSCAQLRLCSASVQLRYTRVKCLIAANGNRTPLGSIWSKISRCRLHGLEFSFNSWLYICVITITWGTLKNIARLVIVHQACEGFLHPSRFDKLFPHCVCWLSLLRFFILKPAHLPNYLLIAETRKEPSFGWET